MVDGFLEEWGRGKGWREERGIGACRGCLKLENLTVILLGWKLPKLENEVMFLQFACGLIQQRRRPRTERHSG